MEHMATDSRGRRVLGEVATLVTPDTILRWQGPRWFRAVHKRGLAKGRP